MVMSVFFSVMSAVVLGTFMRTISSVIIALAPGLPLVSISRRSLGLPATTFKGSLSSFKGSSLIWNGSYPEVYTSWVKKQTGIFKHKTIINICLKVKQVSVTLWICFCMLLKKN